MLILLVDDDELVRTVLSAMLSDAGHEVVETCDPHEALGLPEALGPPDVLITDIDLRAQLNGFDVASNAHHLWPDVRVLLISGLPAVLGNRSIRVTTICKSPSLLVVCWEP